MASVLVPYGTGEGQTAKVADRIADELDARGHGTATVNAAEVGTDRDPDLDDYDAVLVGASVHHGRHQQAGGGSSAPTATRWRRSRPASSRCPGPPPRRRARPRR